MASEKGLGQKNRETTGEILGQTDQKATEAWLLSQAT